jgi:hypothetical protein
MATGQIGTKPLAGAWNIHAKLLGGRRMGGASITRGFGGTAAARRNRGQLVRGWRQATTRDAPCVVLAPLEARLERFLMGASCALRQGDGVATSLVEGSR